jgi:hypothetical protein
VAVVAVVVGEGWVEHGETHRNDRRRWVSLRSTHPTGILPEYYYRNTGLGYLNASKRQLYSRTGSVALRAFQLLCGWRYRRRGVADPKARIDAR